MQEETTYLGLHKNLKFNTKFSEAHSGLLFTSLVCLEFRDLGRPIQKLNSAHKGDGVSRSTKG